jgi:putative oxidoreductase
MQIRTMPRFWRSARERFRLLQLAPLPMRLIIGFGFLEHGVAKLSKGPDNFVRIVDALGVPAPHLMAWLTILTEVVGGALMIAGLFTLPLVLPMAAVLLVALFTVHLQFGFTSIKLMAITPAGPLFGPPGTETDLLYLAGMVTLMFGGPGPFAIDNWIESRRSCPARTERVPAACDRRGR